MFDRASFSFFYETKACRIFSTLDMINDSRLQVFFKFDEKIDLSTLSGSHCQIGLISHQNRHFRVKVVPFDFGTTISNDRFCQSFFAKEGILYSSRASLTAKCQTGHQNRIVHP